MNIKPKIIETLQDKKRKKSFTGSNYFSLSFLCGKKEEAGIVSNRDFIKNVIFKGTNIISVVAEQIYDSFSYDWLDLLTTEEIILDFSTAVIVIIESYGSATELGAFSVANYNIPKIWVIENKEFKLDNSFINNGPLKKIGRQNNIIYLEFQNDGSIVWDGKSISTLQGAKRTSFKTKPILILQNSITIKDLSFVSCLFFDYIRWYGLLSEKSVLGIFKLLCLFKADENIPITIELPANNISDINNVNDVFIGMLESFCKFHILKKLSRKKENYYIIDFSNISKPILNNQKTSLIFSLGFFNVPNRKKLAYIKNSYLKDGYCVW